jgi:hypothetical protein
MRGEVFVDGCPRRGIEALDPVRRVPVNDAVLSNAQAMVSGIFIGQRLGVARGQGKDGRFIARRESE